MKMNQTEDDQNKSQNSNNNYGKFFFKILVQHVKISKEIDANLQKIIQEAFDFMNKDFYILDPMLIPICPETPKKLRELEI